MGRWRDEPGEDGIEIEPFAPGAPRPSGGLIVLDPHARRGAADGDGGDPAGPRRRRHRLGAVVVAVVAALVAVAALAARNGPDRAASTSAPSSRSAPDVARRVPVPTTTTTAPTTTAAPPPTSVVSTVGSALAARPTGGHVAYGVADGLLDIIDVDTGARRTVEIQSAIGTAATPIGVSDGQLVLFDPDQSSITLLDGDGRVVGSSSAGDYLPSAQPDRWYRLDYSGTTETLTATDVFGHVAGPSVTLPGSAYVVSVAPDAALLRGRYGGSYLTDIGTGATRLVSRGDPLALGARHVLVAICTTDLRCSIRLVPRDGADPDDAAAGVEVDAIEAFDNAAGGFSPDGRWAIAINRGPSGRGELTAVETGTGRVVDLGPTAAVSNWYGTVPYSWSPDSTAVVWQDALFRITVWQPDSGAAPIATELPRLRPSRGSLLYQGMLLLPAGAGPSAATTPG